MPVVGEPVHGNLPRRRDSYRKLTFSGYREGVQILPPLPKRAHKFTILYLVDRHICHKLS